MRASAIAGERLISGGWVRRAQLSILYFLLTCTAAAVTRSVWDGVYTKEQAARGQGTYQEVCIQCHGETLGGGEAPPLAGDEFLRKWSGKTIGDLFGVIRKTMPEDNPGNLSSREYSDIVAYILSVNSFPAGEKELDRDVAALNEIRIETKH
jgi:mono/diheme cytochrome c family protein